MPLPIEIAALVSLARNDTRGRGEITATRGGNGEIFERRKMRKKVKKNLAAEAVFEAVREGCSLYAACVKAGISTKEFYEMLAEDDAARVAYQLALSDYADQCMDEIKSIAADLKAGEVDNSTAKLLIETSKWLAQKACPEPFDGRGNVSGEEDDGTAAEIVVKFV